LKFKRMFVRRAENANAGDLNVKRADPFSKQLHDKGCCCGRS